MNQSDLVESAYPSKSAFHTTRWSIVIAAQGRVSPEASQSLATLCQQYWMPLYAFVRKRGHSPHDAQDLTQEFFARLIEKDWLAVVAPENGRFRSFLLMAMKRFLANEWDHAHAQKRGGGRRCVSLDAELAERFIADSSRSILPAESLFEKRWAITLLETVIWRLQDEYQKANKAHEYELLKPCLTAQRGDIPYQDLGMALGVTPGSARSSVHRLRKRFRQLFREEVTSTLADPSELEDEMRTIVSWLGNDQ